MEGWEAGRVWKNKKWGKNAADSQWKDKSGKWKLQGKTRKGKARDVWGESGRGWAGNSHVHLAAGARKAQLVEVQEGHREEGAVQSWEGLFYAGLGWSRPTGALPIASRLWDPSPVSESQALLCGLHSWHKASEVSRQTPEWAARHIQEEVDSSTKTFEASSSHNAPVTKKRLLKARSKSPAEVMACIILPFDPVSSESSSHQNEGLASLSHDAPLD